MNEGFGFPPLEAMATGIPVAASTAASIPEVCGDAAAYFDPLSVDDMTRVIERALCDDALRSQLRDAGTRQARRYSSTDTAAQIASILTRVARA